MGDPSVEVTEESRDESQMSKAKAMDAISEGNSILDQSGFCLFLICAIPFQPLFFLFNLLLSGNLEEAIDHLTNAIVCNPTSAIMYATRGICLFLLLVIFCISVVSVQSS